MIGCTAYAVYTRFPIRMIGESNAVIPDVFNRAHCLDNLNLPFYECKSIKIKCLISYCGIYFL